MNSPESRCSAHGARLRRCPKIRVRKRWQETGLFPNWTAPKCFDSGATTTVVVSPFSFACFASTGGFSKTDTQVPVKILNHLGRQPQLPPALWLAPPDRPATE